MRPDRGLVRRGVQQRISRRSPGITWCVTAGGGEAWRHRQDPPSQGPACGRGPVLGQQLLLGGCPPGRMCHHLLRRPGAHQPAGTAPGAPFCMVLHFENPASSAARSICHDLSIATLQRPFKALVWESKRVRPLRCSVLLQAIRVEGLAQQLYSQTAQQAVQVAVSAFHEVSSFKAALEN